MSPAHRASLFTSDMKFTCTSDTQYPYIGHRSSFSTPQSADTCSSRAAHQLISTLHFPFQLESIFLTDAGKACRNHSTSPHPTHIRSIPPSSCAFHDPGGRSNTGEQDTLADNSASSLNTSTQMIVILNRHGHERDGASLALGAKGVLLMDMRLASISLDEEGSGTGAGADGGSAGGFGSSGKGDTGGGGDQGGDTDAIKNSYISSIIVSLMLQVGLPTSAIFLSKISKCDFKVSPGISMLITGRLTRRLLECLGFIPVCLRDPDPTTTQIILNAHEDIRRGALFLPCVFPFWFVDVHPSSLFPPFQSSIYSIHGPVLVCSSLSDRIIFTRR
ncbi:hypothetical protein BT96DRAFT_997563 [Gymnopus androsaceus JB14]|uniref:Uncharacterized protein n=1 Tax=Gymnopus androsaceus JB14 TaxID=1447944 RepID=A0A6A4HEN7_9AGAR|nr:hypothetical protein BT96DRAFT_997563 [Gymnopus androsaceus JB14]